MLLLFFVLAYQTTLNIGDPLPPYAFDDQFGVRHTPLPETRFVVLAHDKRTGSLARKWLAHTTVDLEAQHVVFLLDTGDMKPKMREKMVLPRLRKHLFPVLLADDPAFLGRIPQREDHLTVLRLAHDGTIAGVDFPAAVEEIDALVQP